MDLFLKKNVVTEKTLSAYGVLAYVAIRKIIDSNIFLKTKQETIINISSLGLAVALFGSNVREKYLLDTLERGIAELVDGGLIEILDDFSNKNRFSAIVDLSGLYFDAKDAKFIVVTDDEIKKIYGLDDSAKRKAIILKYYIALVGTMDFSSHILKKYRGKVSRMPQSYIGSQADVCEKTCRRFNDVLVTAKILYVYKSNDKIQYDNGKTLKQINNCYSRYEDRKLCEEYAKDFEEEQGMFHKLARTKKNKEQADRNRRLAQYYNRIINGHEDDYDADTIREVYRYVKNKNKVLQESIDDLTDRKRLSVREEEYLGRCLSQVRDLTYFDKFLFINDDDQWGESDPLELDFEVETVEPEVAEGDEWIFGM